MCAYKGVKNVGFLENVAYVLNVSFLENVASVLNDP